MDAEGTKRLTLIKSLVAEQGADGDKRWLIARLEVEAQENERLRDEVTRTKDNALDMQRFQQEKVKELEAEARTWRSPQQILRLDAEARCAALEVLFALQQTRMAEAVEAWRKATGKQGISPDLGDLLTWLMDRPAALEAQVRELREAVQTALDWRGLDGDGITDPVALQLACLLTAT